MGERAKGPAVVPAVGEWAASGRGSISVAGSGRSRWGGAGAGGGGAAGFCCSREVLVRCREASGRVSSLSR